MKYVVLTAKHHEGFSMFATKATKFNIVDGTPFKRDVVRELAVACHQAGLKFGVYYSNGQDWHHAGGGVATWHNPDGAWDPAQKGDSEAFVNNIVIPQLRELLNNYQSTWSGGNLAWNFGLRITRIVLPDSLK